MELESTPRTIRPRVSKGHELFGSIFFQQSVRSYGVADNVVLVNGRGPFQARFRALLLRAYGGQCALCDSRLQNVLVASHLRPWALDADNRLNPSNGILLCLTHDALFEAGLIRITPDGEVSLSPTLTAAALGQDLFAFVARRTRRALRKSVGASRASADLLRWKYEAAIAVVPARTGPPEPD